MMTEIPFYDLGEQHAAIRGDIERAVASVLSGAHFISGPEVAAFESEFAAYCGARACVGVGNGLDAITLTLRALGIGSGDEVIVPGHTFVATWLGVRLAGATPVGVDVSEDTFTIDPARVAMAIGPRTRAIMPVHLYGQPADIEALRALADRHGLALIEDAAQAHGAEYGGRRAGTLGTAAAFSFYPTKNLGALGDGGAVVTDDIALAERIRTLGNYGSSRKYIHVVAGVNSRLDELQAAVLRVKLSALDELNERRQLLAARYDLGLAGAGLTLPGVGDRRTHVRHLYVVRSKQRDELGSALRDRGIQTLVHYPIPAHRQEAMADLPSVDLPVSERLAAEVLSLPFWPTMSFDTVDRVCDAVQRATSHLSSKAA